VNAGDTVGQVVAARLVTVTRTLSGLKKEWDKQEAWPPGDRTRGAVVRSGLSKLGPCFVKIGQTLSQRPDVVRRQRPCSVVRAR
jgi:predicted unusual protein kinase regulating ubiquinone biosynthesis (AarF/ABC1/UbiB family)